MIVLDTSVVSGAMKPKPHPAVRAWLNDQVAETLYLSSVTLAELLFGIGALPVGKRKDMLVQTLDGLMGLFRGRVLLFDVDAARHYAELAVMTRVAGRGFSTPDGYIAAIAASRGFIVASRDTAPYEAASVTVINPWLVPVSCITPPCFRLASINPSSSPSSTAWVRAGHAAENLAIIRRFALNILRLNKRPKLGVKNKRLRAPYDDDFRAEVLNFK